MNPKSQTLLAGHPKHLTEGLCWSHDSRAKTRIRGAAIETRNLRGAGVFPLIWWEGANFEASFVRPPGSIHHIVFNVKRNSERHAGLEDDFRIRRKRWFLDFSPCCSGEILFGLIGKILKLVSLVIPYSQSTSKAFTDNSKYTDVRVYFSCYCILSRNCSHTILYVYLYTVYICIWSNKIKHVYKVY